MVSDQKRSSIPKTVETVIIGNGPSALFLSFLLHGNVPYYNPQKGSPHPDTILDRKLSIGSHQPLYHALENVNHLCEHFDASGRYSDDAWPVNTLLDALIWPESDSGTDSESTIVFRQDPKDSLKHIVLGSASRPGGQWAESGSLTKGENARTLSYSEQLSLPGYSFAEFYAQEYGRSCGTFERPRRPEVSAYYAKYPSKVGINDAFRQSTLVTSVVHQAHGMYAVSGTDEQGLPFTITCRHLVLACGLFTHLIEPPVILSPYIRHDDDDSSDTVTQTGSILVLGSGFSAADAVIENLGRRKVVHLYRWETAQYVSPLKHCHRSSYPEYADVYQRMKLATHTKDYQGHADCVVTKVEEHGKLYKVTITNLLGESSSLIVSEIAVLAGRRTSLDFLSPKLLHSLEIDSIHGGWLEKTGLRDRIEAKGAALTVDHGKILCIGSITGDSLIKFMFGAVMGAAGHLRKETSH